VSGVLTGEDGVPLAGYWLVARSTDTGAFSSVVNPMDVFQKTDRRGRFEFPALKGTFGVKVISHSFPWPTEEVIYSPYPMPAFLGDDHTFDGSVEHVELPIHAVPSVRVTGRCISPSGNPVRGNQIGISFQKGNRTENLQVAATSADGRYAFEGIPRGIKGVWLFSSLGWAEGALVTLKALPDVIGARPDGQVYWASLDADMDGVDFGVPSSQPPDEVRDVSDKPAAALDSSPQPEGLDRIAVGVLIVLSTTVTWLVFRGVSQRTRSRQSGGRP
jgi:hypothetical protein